MSDDEDFWGHRFRRDAKADKKVSNVQLSDGALQKETVAERNHAPEPNAAERRKTPTPTTGSHPQNSANLTTTVQNSISTGEKVLRQEIQKASQALKEQETPSESSVPTHKNSKRAVLGQVTAESIPNQGDSGSESNDSDPFYSDEQDEDGQTSAYSSDELAIAEGMASDSDSEAGKSEDLSIFSPDKDDSREEEGGLRRQSTVRLKSADRALLQRKGKGNTEKIEKRLPTPFTGATKNENNFAAGEETRGRKVKKKGTFNKPKPTVLRIIHKPPKPTAIKEQFGNANDWSSIKSSTSSARTSALADRVFALEKQLHETIAKNRTLEQIQRRQEAIAAREEKQRQQNFGSSVRLTSEERLCEEIRVLNARLRLQKDKMKEQERILKERTDQLQLAGDRMSKLQEKVKKSNAPGDKEPSKERREQMEQLQRRIEELQRHLALVEKSHKRAFSMEVQKRKQSEEKVKEIEATLEKVKKERYAISNLPRSAQHAGSSDLKKTAKRSNSSKHSEKEISRSSGLRNDEFTSKVNSSAQGSEKHTDKTKKKPRSKSTNKIKKGSISDEAMSEGSSGKGEWEPKQNGGRFSHNANHKEATVVPSLKLVNGVHSEHGMRSDYTSSVADVTPSTKKQQHRDSYPSLTYRRESLSHLQNGNRTANAATTNGIEGTKWRKAKQSSTKEDDPFVDLKPARVNRSNSRQSPPEKSDVLNGNQKGSNASESDTLLDELFGPRRQPSQPSNQGRPSEEKKSADKALHELTETDLFPELNKKQRNPQQNKTSAGLFNWER